MPNFKYAAVAGWAALTALNLAFFFLYADLRPRVDEDFFFSQGDPQLSENRSIEKNFPQPTQFFVSVRGDVLSENHLKTVAALTDRILAVSGVQNVQSLTRGPDSPEHAVDSPLWSRLLVAPDKNSSSLVVFAEQNSVEGVVGELERIRAESRASGADVVVSGAPYIIEMIRRSLAMDLRVFTLAAIVVFGLAVWSLFRSLWILTGTLAACVNTSLLTLLAGQTFRIPLGPLTANVSTIVFVLCLSHIVFVSFNWKNGVYDPPPPGRGHASHAVRMTLLPSLWSMATALLGFVSLLFVPATPFRQLGTAGAMGTLIAFACAYLIFPPFLAAEDERRGGKGISAAEGKRMRISSWFRPYRGLVAACIALPALFFAAAGIWRLNTDPSLFSYFQSDTPLRDGLEFIDANGGSIPLEVVVERADGKGLADGESMAKLSALNEAFEKEEAVGSALSLPVFVEEAKSKALLRWMPSGWLIQLMKHPRFGAVTPYFLTEDGKEALFVLRMNEAARQVPRPEVVERIRAITREHGFEPKLVGGVYALQGQLSKLVSKSVLEGLFFLVLIFTPVAWVASGSPRIAVAVAVSVSLIPLGMLGVIGSFGIPFDIISAPASNIAIAIGIDAMLHLLVYVRRRKGEGFGARLWDRAVDAQWRPIFYSMAMICAGFGIFGLSSFPPTQRFGFSVLIGSVIAPAAALGVLPWLCIAFRTPRRSVQK